MSCSAYCRLGCHFITIKMISLSHNKLPHFYYRKVSADPSNKNRRTAVIMRVIKFSMSGLVTVCMRGGEAWCLPVESCERTGGYWPAQTRSRATAWLTRPLQNNYKQSTGPGRTLYFGNQFSCHENLPPQSGRYFNSARILRSQSNIFSRRNVDDTAKNCKENCSVFSRRSGITAWHN